MSIHILTLSFQSKFNISFISNGLASSSIISLVPTRDNALGLASTLLHRLSTGAMLAWLSLVRRLASCDRISSDISLQSMFNSLELACDKQADTSGDFLDTIRIESQVDPASNHSNRVNKQQQQQ